MPSASKAIIAVARPVLRLCLIVGLLVGLGVFLGRSQHQVYAAGLPDDSSLYVSGVISSRIDCLSVGGDSLAIAGETYPGSDICPSTGVVTLNWAGEPGRARLVLRTSGATSAHSILVNGKLAAKAPLFSKAHAATPHKMAPSAAPSRPGVDDPGLLKQVEPVDVYYLTIPVELVLQGENQIELTVDASPGNEPAGDRWWATDVRLELFGRADQPGLVALPVDAGSEASMGAADVSLSAVQSIVEFTNAYDGSTQQAAIQVPDGYQSDQATPLVIYVHGRAGVMSMGIDQLGEAADAKGWLLASPQLHGSWDVPPECYVYPNDCSWDDKILTGTTGPNAEPRPGAYAYASLESQYDVVGTVRYMLEHYNVELDRIYLYGVSMGGQIAVVTAAKYPHIFAATLETMGPTDAGPWHDEQIQVLGLWSPALTAMRKECHVDGVAKYPDENPFCYQQRSGLYFARNYVVQPGARPPISITHSTADLLVPVHHARGLRDAINGFGPAQPVLIFEDQVEGPTCPPYYHCYAPEPMASLDYYEPNRLNNSPTHIQIASDQSKSYYWLNLVQSGAAHWSYVEANAQPEIASISIDTQDAEALTLGVNLGTAPIAVPELGNALLQPGLGFPATTYLVRGSTNDGLHDYSSAYLNVDVAAGQAAVTISALNVTLSADPAVVVVDPQGSTVVSVDVRDAFGYVVPEGTEITLETTWGVFDNGDTIHRVYTAAGMATAVLTLTEGSDLAQVTATCGMAAGSVDIVIESGAPTVAPMAVSDLGGTRAGSDLALSWSEVTHDTLGDPVTIDHYVVYRRADEPYFVPTPSAIIGTPASPGFVDPGVLGDPAHNYTYLVAAVDDSGVESAPSNRLGAFDFELVPAAAVGERAYNLVALNLEVQTVVDADSLAAYAGAANGGHGVYMALRHDAASQSLQWRLPGLAGTNFPVGLGDAVYLYLDETAPGVVSLVGGVPDIGMVSFALTPGVPAGSCVYNFISVPLHRNDLVDADALAADIGGVYSVSRYNADTQDLTWRIPGVSGENFPVRVGYPYIVCLDETAPAAWP